MNDQLNLIAQNSCHGPLAKYPVILMSWYSKWNFQHNKGKIILFGNPLPTISEEINTNKPSNNRKAKKKCGHSSACSNYLRAVCILAGLVQVYWPWFLCCWLNLSSTFPVFIDFDSIKLLQYWKRVKGLTGYLSFFFLFCCAVVDQQAPFRHLT